jgi:hypothetical protein
LGGILAFLKQQFSPGGVEITFGCTPAVGGINPYTIKTQSRVNSFANKFIIHHSCQGNPAIEATNRKRKILIRP